MFWPTESFNVYGHDPVEVGVRSIPIGFGILAGACIALVLLTVLRGHTKEILIISSVLMTAGKLSNSILHDTMSLTSFLKKDVALCLSDVLATCISFGVFLSSLAWALEASWCRPQLSPLLSAQMSVASPEERWKCADAFI